MDQVVEVRSQADAASVVSVNSSEPPEESGLLSDLWRRVRYIRWRNTVEQVVHVPEGSSPTGNLQDVLNEVSGQAPDEPAPSEAPSSSGRDVEKCGVCERSFNHRGPTVTCSGCAQALREVYEDVRES